MCDRCHKINRSIWKPEARDGEDCFHHWSKTTKASIDAIRSGGNGSAIDAGASSNIDDSANVEHPCHDGEFFETKEYPCEEEFAEDEYADRIKEKLSTSLFGETKQKGWFYDCDWAQQHELPSFEHLIASFNRHTPQCDEAGVVFQPAPNTSIEQGGSTGSIDQSADIVCESDAIFELSGVDSIGQEDVTSSDNGSGIGHEENVELSTEKHEAGNVVCGDREDSDCNGVLAATEQRIRRARANFRDLGLRHVNGKWISDIRGVDTKQYNEYWIELQETLKAARKYIKEHNTTIKKSGTYSKGSRAGRESRPSRKRDERKLREDCATGKIKNSRYVGTDAVGLLANQKKSSVPKSGVCRYGRIALTEPVLQGLVVLRPGFINSTESWCEVISGLDYETLSKVYSLCANIAHPYCNVVDCPLENFLGECNYRLAKMATPAQAIVSSVDTMRENLPGSTKQKTLADWIGHDNIRVRNSRKNKRASTGPTVPRRSVKRPTDTIGKHIEDAESVYNTGECQSGVVETQSDTGDKRMPEDERRDTIVETINGGSSSTIAGDSNTDSNGPELIRDSSCESYKQSQDGLLEDVRIHEEWYSDEDSRSVVVNEDAELTTSGMGDKARSLLRNAGATPRYATPSEDATQHAKPRRVRKPKAISSVNDTWHVECRYTYGLRSQRTQGSRRSSAINGTQTCPHGYKRSALIDNLNGQVTSLLITNPAGRSCIMLSREQEKIVQAGGPITVRVRIDNERREGDSICQAGEATRYFQGPTDDTVQKPQVQCDVSQVHTPIGVDAIRSQRRRRPTNGSKRHEHAEKSPNIKAHVVDVPGSSCVESRLIKVGHALQRIIDKDHAPVLSHNDTGQRVQRSSKPPTSEHRSNEGWVKVQSSRKRDVRRYDHSTRQLRVDNNNSTHAPQANGHTLQNSRRWRRPRRVGRETRGPVANEQDGIVVQVTRPKPQSRWADRRIPKHSVLPTQANIPSRSMGDDAGSTKSPSNSIHSNGQKRRASLPERSVGNESSPTSRSTNIGTNLPQSNTEVPANRTQSWYSVCRPRPSNKSGRKKHHRDP